MHVMVAPEARLEFEAAVAYYERQLPGLGARLRDDIRAALRRARIWPLASPIERGDIRRLTLSRFPYKVLYAVEPDHLYILAVAHQHRKPDYWVGRSESP